MDRRPSGVASHPDMQRFWDERARENALYFVDNTLDYRSPDAERFWREGERVVETILETLGVRIEPEQEIVEIGCGVGRLTRALAARARRVCALDVSEEMLARAREASPELSNVEWLHGNGTTLTGVPDAAADGCFSHVVFQHIPDPAITLGYIREMGRVLRSGGFAAFHVSNDPGVHRPRGRSGLAQRLLERLGRAPRGRDNAAWLGSAVDLDDLRRTADQAGMDVERVENAGTQFCYVLLRRR